jgi:hypothetical protein
MTTLPTNYRIIELHGVTPKTCHAVALDFFDMVASADQKEPFSDLPLAEAMARVAQIGLRHNMYFMYFAPYDVNAAPKMKTGE